MAKYADLASATTDGMVHHWPMQETSGTGVADVIGAWDAECFGDSFSGPELSPAEYDATVVSTPAGRGRDMGANWDGTSGGIEKIATLRLAQSALDPAFSAFTLRVRYFHTSLVEDVRSSHSMTLFQFGQINDYGVLISVANGEVYFAAGDADSGSDVIPDPFIDGAWHDVVVAGDVNGTGLYINGSLIYSLTGSSNFLIYNTASNTARSFFGASEDGDYYILGTTVDGVFQDASIWERKLTPQEISDLNSDGISEPLITDTSPITYDVALDVTLPIQADFSVQVNPVLVSMDALFPIRFQAAAFQDWVSKLPPTQIQELYRLVLTGAPDGLDDLYIGGISSWQATNQAGSRSAYVQAVIPAADQYVDDIEARSNGELVIQKGYKLATGQVQFEEILRSAFDEARPDQGRSSLTLTVSGYMRGKPYSVGSRALTGIRSTSKHNGKRRVFCDIDLFLQPGMIVTALNDSFQADYINYYVNRTDKFCEVGER